MKKLTLTVVLASSFLIGCSSGAPDGFCECLEKSEALNAVAQQVLLGNDTQEKGQDLMRLREEKAEMCQDFEASSGADMIEWRKECEE